MMTTIKHPYKFIWRDLWFIPTHSIWPWLCRKKLWKTSDIIVIIDGERIIKGKIINE